jgi:hypothetical protein
MAEIIAAGPDQIYRDNLEKGAFKIQQCASCEKYVFYPRHLCPHCGSASLQWKSASGRAQVYSTTVARRRPDRGGDYNVCIVELEEGPRMTSRVEGIDPDQVTIGMDLTHAIADGGDAGPFIVFNPVKSAED